LSRCLLPSSHLLYALLVGNLLLGELELLRRLHVLSVRESHRRSVHEYLNVLWRRLQVEVRGVKGGELDSRNLNCLVEGNVDEQLLIGVGLEGETVVAYEEVLVSSVVALIQAVAFSFCN
jgi:hypothetical protein